ncbi:MAG: nucleoside triphosphate pyrophosphohydrolase family protein [Candidatus Thorarchaeota archaeon]|nr:hypothetical protein [Thermoplasmatales archaeon]
MLGFNEYQKIAFSTAIYPNKNNNFVYPVLGLVGETGEVAEKIKKIIRDYNSEITDEMKIAIKKELGDVFWYLAAVCTELEFDMEDIAWDNLKKLESRRERGKIQGSGDDR